MKKAVVLLSGGLDSSTTLYLAKKFGFKCYALTFDYGQRHKKEILAAQKISCRLSIPLKVIKITLPWAKDALLDKKRIIPQRKLEKITQYIPSTYVAARNTIFLSFAISYAESIGAEAIFIGANTRDWSGYPDCTPEYFKAFNQVIKIGTKAGRQKKKILIQAPLINKTKEEIVRLAKGLNIPFELTWSCYQGGRKPCGQCDACQLRAKGFKEVGIIDPLINKKAHKTKKT